MKDVKFESKPFSEFLAGDKGIIGNGNKKGLLRFMKLATTLMTPDGQEVNAVFCANGEPFYIRESEAVFPIK